MTEIDAVLTPLPLADAFAGFRAGLTTLRDAPPSDDELALAVAHAYLETGAFRSMFCWNLGNAKATSGWLAAGGDHCFYACGEEFALSYAQQLVAAAPALVSIVRTYVGVSGAQMASVKVLPKHPIARFRAFKDRDTGIREHLEVLRGSFPRAWASLATGDVVAFATDLHVEGYFTDALAHYLHGSDGKGGLAAVLAELRPKVPEVATGEVVRDNRGDEIGNADVTEDPDARAEQ